jgi:DNA-binding CsgD family transcriptional regulator
MLGLASAGELAAFSPAQIEILGRLLANAVAGVGVNARSATSPGSSLSPIDPARLTFARSGLQTLTQRERQVLDAVLDGHSNKVSGMLFGISPRTVEVHRHRINQKLGARNTAELVRLASAVLAGSERH